MVLKGIFSESKCMNILANQISHMSTLHSKTGPTKAHPD